MVAGNQHSSLIGAAADFFNQDRTCHHSEEQHQQHPASFLAADAKLASTAAVETRSSRRALPSSLADTCEVPMRLRCVRSRARNAHLGASFLGLNSESDHESLRRQVETLVPQSLNVATGSMPVPNRLAGTSFLDLHHAHKTPECVSSFNEAVSEDPEVMTMRASAAAEHAEDDAAFALHKALSVGVMADTAIMYCYAAVFIAMVMAALGVLNGLVDWWGTKRDEGACEELEQELNTSGWPAYRARWLPGAARGSASSSGPSAAGGSGSQQR